MKRFVTFTTATILAATPLVAEQATEKVNQPTSPVYSEGFPPDDAYGSAGLIGSEVYTTNRGRDDLSVDGLDHSSLVEIGDVSDVLINAKGNMSGILVDPTVADSDALMFFPASQVIVVDDPEGTRYMVSYTEDEMSEIERVERDNWM